MNYRVLACGSNGNHQLGLGHADDCDVLCEVTSLTRVGQCPRKFAFGGNHTWALFPDGTLYVAGSNEYGQCGIASPKVLTEFVPVPGKWKDVAAGWEYSVLCSCDDRVYTCGRGPKGELGLGERVTTTGTELAEVLAEVDLPALSLSISSLGCSINHTVVTYSDGTHVGWGACRKGQLGPQPSVVLPSGREKPLPVLYRPTRLQLPSGALCLGRDRTVVSDGSTITVFGTDATSQHSDATKVRAMWSSVHSLTADGQLRSFGNNLHGQLYSYDEPVVDFEVGSEHGLAVLQDGAVYAWGWGEHGNCGRKQKESVTFDYLNKLHGGEPIVHMACGLATTWLVLGPGAERM